MGYPEDYSGPQYLYPGKVRPFWGQKRQHHLDKHGFGNFARGAFGFKHVTSVFGDDHPGINVFGTFLFFHAIHHTPKSKNCTFITFLEWIVILSLRWKVVTWNNLNKDLFPIHVLNICRFSESSIPILLFLFSFRTRSSWACSLPARRCLNPLLCHSLLHIN